MHPVELDRAHCGPPSDESFESPNRARRTIATSGHSATRPRKLPRALAILECVMTDCCTRCRRIGEMKLRSVFDGDAAIDHTIKFQLCDQCLAYFRALRAHDAEIQEQRFRQSSGGSPCSTARKGEPHERNPSMILPPGLAMEGVESPRAKQRRNFPSSDCISNCALVRPSGKPRERPDSQRSLRMNPALLRGRLR